MKKKYEAWFIKQSFYHQLRYVLGDRIFDFDDGIGYRNLTVQVGYVAFCGCDVEFVFNDALQSYTQTRDKVEQRLKNGARITSHRIDL